MSIQETSRKSNRPPIMFMSPPKYVQGPGVLDELHLYVKELGSRVTVISDEFVWELFGERVARSAEKGGLELNSFIFSGLGIIASCGVPG